ncbi:LuxR C-terminal-related transcriptional regulator [Conexibacter stalactiti]|uniref:LuxR C-terminal-related transcriptional regulator n=1 Tax=Conexibacter stalactiti TaxID=1940611 RepID=A0ABU4HKK1_9ACTN|nr:LuxR C-terminal-related transcriptional regulator [Conexibacter stalactiti]MDW5593828.1 LuxR C-terminal-related transcriptional regulator [Conexibacter stalactiti]MEC5034470.1 LuxR C-terminal-related transcriptional regulator [Conexibacter stalactiti]
MRDLSAPLVNEAKLRVPHVHRETIGRRRVTRLLLAGDSRPLTVVCAPAGFGKTTALAQWVETAPQPTAWLSLDAHDDDPRRLVAHLLAALERVRPGAASEAERALRGGSDLLETVLPLLLDALAHAATPDGLAIVFDDWHLVREPPCQRLLTALIDSLPPRVRVVVASRSAPPLRLARRRAAGTIAEIGREALTFRPAETERLLNGALALALRPDQLAAVEERIAGWPVGLALVGASMPAKPDRDRFLQAFSRSRSDVAEYLVDEVLDQLDPALRVFLRRTSILSRLNESLCAAVLDDPAAGELLDEARRSDLFLTVLDDADPGGTWMRCHQLFAELLERELRVREPALIATLHLRASRWYEERGRVEEAIVHASAAGDGHRAAALVHRHGERLMRTRQYLSVRRLIDAIPPDRGEFGPYCRALHLLAGGLDGVSPDEMYAGFRELRADYASPGVELLVEHCLLSPFFGRVREAVERGRALSGRTREQPLSVRAAVAANLGVLLWFAGESRAAQAVLEPHVDAMVERRRTWALATLALADLDSGLTERALARASAAISEVEENGGESAFEHALVYQAATCVLRAAGRREQAEATLARAARLTRKIPDSLYDAFTLLLQAELELDRRDRSGAREAATAARAIIARYPDVGVLEPRLAAVEAALRREAGELLGSDLTRAERRVLELLPSDLSRSGIAAALYLSQDTVGSHLRRIYRRLGVSSRAEAVAAARASGLLAPAAAPEPAANSPR